MLPRQEVNRTAKGNRLSVMTQSHEGRQGPLERRGLLTACEGSMSELTVDAADNAPTVCLASSPRAALIATR
jgi:hypothetical protein